MDDAAEAMDWQVLVNDAAQYSLWPALDPVPAGWRATGPGGDHASCVAYVEAHWTDMRPLTLREGNPRQ